MAKAKKKRTQYLQTAKAKVQIHLPKKKGRMTMSIVLPADIERQLAKRLWKRFKNDFDGSGS
jgi:translation initiation factor 1 (eIF-1/SUI1)